MLQVGRETPKRNTRHSPCDAQSNVPRQGPILGHGVIALGPNLLPLFCCCSTCRSYSYPSGHTEVLAAVTMVTIIISLVFFPCNIYVGGSIILVKHYTDSLRKTLRPKRVEVPRTESLWTVRPLLDALFPAGYGFVVAAFSAARGSHPPRYPVFRWSHGYDLVESRYRRRKTESRLPTKLALSTAEVPLWDALGWHPRLNWQRNQNDIRIDIQFLLLNCSYDRYRRYYVEYQDSHQHTTS